ncbi:MAG: hypothetical protein R2748_08835 [Bryobacterales bacterium]
MLEPCGGFSPERQLQIKVKNGPFQVVTGKFTLPGGGFLDWHDHPGTGVITVTKGAFDEFKASGCVALHGPGGVFFEVQGEVHRIANASATEPAEGLITFFLPVGSAAPVAFVPPPRERPCAPGQSEEPDEDETASLEEIQAAVSANATAVSRIHDLLTRVARSLSLNPLEARLESSRASVS